MILEDYYVTASPSSLDLVNLESGLSVDSVALACDTPVQIRALSRDCFLLLAKVGLFQVWTIARHSDGGLHLRLLNRFEHRYEGDDRKRFEVHYTADRAIFPSRLDILPGLRALITPHHGIESVPLDLATGRELPKLRVGTSEERCVYSGCKGHVAFFNGASSDMKLVSTLPHNFGEIVHRGPSLHMSVRWTLLINIVNCRSDRMPEWTQLLTPRTGDSDEYKQAYATLGIVHARSLYDFRYFDKVALGPETVPVLCLNTETNHEMIFEVWVRDASTCAFHLLCVVNNKEPKMGLFDRIYIQSECCFIKCKAILFTVNLITCALAHITLNSDLCFFPEQDSKNEYSSALLEVGVFNECRDLIGIVVPFLDRSIQWPTM